MKKWLKASDGMYINPKFVRAIYIDWFSPSGYEIRCNMDDNNIVKLYQPQKLTTYEDASNELANIMYIMEGGE